MRLLAASAALAFPADPAAFFRTHLAPQAVFAGVFAVTGI